GGRHRPFNAIFPHGVVSARRVNVGIRGFGWPETTPPRISHHFRDGTDRLGGAVASSVVLKADTP
ncbi:MAG: hypothetical protein NZM27_03990, partial [Acetobacteraceae bacterium]|nr:hypothetical protein [Acetobacteraceae bacterium]